MHTIKAYINRKKYPVSFFSLNCGTTGYFTGAYLLFEFIPYYLLWSEQHSKCRDLRYLPGSVLIV